jgi:hypothetical protein
VVFQPSGQRRPLRALEEQGRGLLLDLEYPCSAGCACNSPSVSF